MKDIISGRVIFGEGRGERVGFPTINLNVKRVPRTLKSGIYAVRVFTKIGNFCGVAHYGQRPFFGLPKSFEVHCLGLKQEIYRRQVKVEIVRRIRSVKDFKTLGELRRQIKKDIKVAQKWSQP